MGSWISWAGRVAVGSSTIGWIGSGTTIGGCAGIIGGWVVKTGGFDGIV